MFQPTDVVRQVRGAEVEQEGFGRVEVLERFEAGLAAGLREAVGVFAGLDGEGEGAEVGWCGDGGEDEGVDLVADFGGKGEEV